jgi:hypothetical protein
LANLITFDPLLGFVGNEIAGEADWMEGAKLKDTCIRRHGM